MPLSIEEQVALLQQSVQSLIDERNSNTTELRNIASEFITLKGRYDQQAIKITTLEAKLVVFQHKTQSLEQSVRNLNATIQDQQLTIDGLKTTTGRLKETIEHQDK